MDSRHPHILNASTNLLGICFVVITGLKLTASNQLSWADEIAWLASFCFLASTALSYMAVRNAEAVQWQADWAERSFLAGVASLSISVMTMAIFVRTAS